MAQAPVSYRSEAHKQHSPDGEIKLFTFTHPSLAVPIRVCSGYTQRLSLEPLKYGVISNGVAFEYLNISDVWPDDVKDSPPKASITLENITYGMTQIARGITGPQATVSIAIVMHSAPNVVVGQFNGLKIRGASGDENSVTFDISAESDYDEPTGRLMAKDQFPGLHGIRSA